MKSVSEELSNYLNREKNMICNDLIELHLADGTVLYYTNADKTVEYNGNIYKHNELLLQRQQVKINDCLVVDTMTVTVFAKNDAKIGNKGIMLAAHDGTLDRATLQLKRCFFDSDFNILDVLGVFGGNVEVKKCAGLRLELIVKAKTQGLSQEFPRRKYYPQGAYTTTGGKVTASSNDSESCIIAPFVPLKEVLM